MINNEKGFTYPITLCLLIIFLLFFSMHTQKLLTERKMSVETALILQQEYYFLSSVKKVENMYQSTGTIPPSGSIPFQKGIMKYQTEPPMEHLLKVNFTLSLQSGETLLGKGYFDMRTKRLTRWTVF
ncbi:competence type IV pilus minor pilin ComGG [Neobacillus thermocopriae]|nr:competence type IV pilus minor pilin ComGG [Neobacillus thermocopriae]MED3624656.1 competence type IV pilus minor pilin ComGG [Neobacillus thermocopriae]